MSVKETCVDDAGHNFMPTGGPTSVVELDKNLVRTYQVIYCTRCGEHRKITLAEDVTDAVQN